MNTRLLALPVVAALSFSAAYGTPASGRGAGAATNGNERTTSGEPMGHQPSPTMSVPPSPSPTMSVPMSPSPTMSVPPSPSVSAPGSPGAPAPTSSPVGPGCASLPKSGPGSAAQLANEPLGTAAQHIPQLSDAVNATKSAGMLSAADSVKNVTVFAPTNDAFRKVPKDELDRLRRNKSQLTKVVSYHVVQGRKSLNDLLAGPVKTMEGSKLTVRRSDSSYMVDDAKVVCGAIQTRNATVYLIDSFLTPSD
ncbi:fasciclin domain-containing protein [Sphaerisporangium fuscum]|uniref:fasciclin domain-containing protein n=1 Tax=Sphaerisporangium fuscum TaxID=2835868 RepID=UPI001BDD10C5|nr:fasciclin domain-containing protein [Sphaerisporangium fuscum]